jgi:hypothetical protein
MRTMRGAPVLLSIAMAAVVLAAPISTAWHELTVQHVLCAEHGELTHVGTTHELSVGAVRNLAAIEAQRGGIETAGGHDHCSLGCVVRSGVLASVVRTAARYVPPVTSTLTKPALPPCFGRGFVLASAPKTSPPSA